jgi:integrase
MAKGLRWRRGAWECQVTIHGQRHYKSFRYANSDAGLRKAIAAREEWVRQLTHGERRYDSTLPFGNLAQAFLDQTDVKPSTGYSYKQILNQYWMPTLATKPVYTIRPSHIREILASHNVSQKTKKNALIPLRLVFKLGLEEELISSNPVDAVSIKRHQKPAIQRFTPSEKAKILGRLEGDSWLFYKLAFETGMRTGEILALRWEDISGDTILVERAMVRREITDTKIHKVRQVFINQEMVTLLSNHPRRFAGGAIFLDQNGNQRRETKKYLADWTATLKKCRMTYRRPYICRHTRASEMLMAGVEPAFAAKQLGHTTEMFLNTYADWISGVKDRDQVNLLNSI